MTLGVGHSRILFSLYVHRIFDGFPVVLVLVLMGTTAIMDQKAGIAEGIKSVTSDCTSSYCIVFHSLHLVINRENQRGKSHFLLNICSYLDMSLQLCSAQDLAL